MLICTRFMEFVGEHLLPGKIGNVFVILAFAFALLSTISYFLGTKETKESLAWKKLGRLSFRIHSLAVKNQSALPTKIRTATVIWVGPLKLIHLPRK